MAVRPFAVSLLLGTLACGASAPQSARSDVVAVTVRAVALDPLTSTPVIVLEEIAGERRLPIWVGVAEARSIAQQLDQVEPPRPNTHDLAKRLLDGLEGEVQRVVVTDLRDGTYYAILELDVRGRPLVVDSRPSDAIAIALRASAPVFVRDWLFEAGNHDSAEKHPVEREI